MKRDLRKLEMDYEEGHLSYAEDSTRLLKRKWGELEAKQRKELDVRSKALKARSQLTENRLENLRDLSQTTMVLAAKKDELKERYGPWSLITWTIAATRCREHQVKRKRVEIKTECDR